LGRAADCLDTLKQVGASSSTKFVVPMEFSGLFNGLRSLIPAESSDGIRGGSSEGTRTQD